MGLPFERVARGCKFGGLDDPDYLALNPNGLVPTVIDGDLVLWESQAILRHYARQNPGAALFPGNPADAARRDMVMDWNITTLWPPIAVAYRAVERSEEHTSELQSLMRISYAVFCLKKQNH